MDVFRFIVERPNHSAKPTSLHLLPLPPHVAYSDPRADGTGPFQPRVPQIWTQDCGLPA